MAEQRLVLFKDSFTPAHSVTPLDTNSYWLYLTKKYGFGIERYIGVVYPMFENGKYVIFEQEFGENSKSKILGRTEKKDSVDKIVYERAKTMAQAKEQELNLHLEDKE